MAKNKKRPLSAYLEDIDKLSSSSESLRKELESIKGEIALNNIRYHTTLPDRLHRMTVGKSGFVNIDNANTTLAYCPSIIKEVIKAVKDMTDVNNKIVLRFVDICKSFVSLEKTILRMREDISDRVCGSEIYSSNMTKDEFAEISEPFTVDGFEVLINTLDSMSDIDKMRYINKVIIDAPSSIEPVRSRRVKLEKYINDFPKPDRQKSTEYQNALLLRKKLTEREDEVLNRVGTLVKILSDSMRKYLSLALGQAEIFSIKSRELKIQEIVKGNLGDLYAISFGIYDKLQKAKGIN